MSLRVGVIGAGWVATHRHVPAYLRHPAVESVTICDKRPDRALGAARQGVAAWPGDLKGFLAEQFDIVSVCTSPWSHAELTVSALEQGSNVLTEKPMAMNGADARTMVHAAETTGRLLCVCHNFLFSNAVVAADGLVERAGPLQYAVGMQMSSDRRRLPEWYRDLPGGLLFDELPHMLYTAEHYLGGLRLHEVRASWDTEGQPKTVEIQLEGEAPAQVTALFTSPLSEWHVTLVGRTGVVDLDLFRDFAAFIGPDREHKASDILRTSARTMAGHVSGFATSGFRLVRGRQSWGHEALVHRFVDAVAGLRPSPVPLGESMAVVDLTDRILGELARAPGRTRA